MIVRELAANELERVAELDRSEHITQQYMARGVELVCMTVDIQAARWGERSGDSLQGYIDAWRMHLESGGALYGALGNGVLIGAALVAPPAHPLPKAVANLAALYVSRAHRGQGVGQALMHEVLVRARDWNADSLYVSATPTKSTVDFYLAQGCVVLERPNEQMLAKEPADIHLLLKL